MENMKQFVRDFNRRQPISAMALSYLFDKGAQGILNATEEEYSAGIDRAIAEAEANHHVYFMTKENLFIVEDGNIEDGSARYKCLSCEGTFNTDEIVIQVGEA